MGTVPTIIPTLRYRDVDKALTWLTDVLGFAEGLVVRDSGGRVEHAQLTYGTGMIMLSSFPEGQAGRLDVDQGPSSNYVILDEIDAHYERVVAAGAEVVRDLREESYGGKGYVIRDAELNVWSVGTYRPTMG